jgi:hypothetical protein
MVGLVVGFVIALGSDDNSVANRLLFAGGIAALGGTVIAAVGALGAALLYTAPDVTTERSPQTVRATEAKRRVPLAMAVATLALMATVSIAWAGGLFDPDPPYKPLTQSYDIAVRCQNDKPYCLPVYDLQVTPKGVLQVHFQVSEATCPKIRVHVKLKDPDEPPEHGGGGGDEVYASPPLGPNQSFTRRFPNLPTRRFFVALQAEGIKGAGCPTGSLRDWNGKLTITRSA